MLTFKKHLLEFTRDFIVHYVETREKASSRINRRVDFGVTAIGRDIIEAISFLGLENRKYVAFGASLSATAMIDCCENFWPAPLCFILLEPNAVFDYPVWSLPLIRWGAPFYRFLRPAAKWYLRNFRVNTREDYEMYRINCRALDSANPAKLRDVILAISNYRIWDRLETVRTPALIIGASKDTFHRHGDIVRMLSAIKSSSYCDLEVHDRTHSRELVEHVRRYLLGLREAPAPAGENEKGVGRE
jgi:hypothetical protein